MSSEAKLVYVTIALSGLTALGAEVVWTRLLSLLFGATAYTFSMILAVFLTGLGIGSSLGSALARGAANPRAALGWCQVGICAALAWAAYATGTSLPFWPINPSISTSLSFTFQLDLMRAIWVMLPGAILWGASFPLALAAVATRGQDPARLVGGVYAANTVGAIVGALVTSLGLVGTVGSQIAQQALIGVAALSGLLMLGGSNPAAVLGAGAGARGGDRRRGGPAGARRAAVAGDPGGLRTLRGDVGGAERDHLRGRGRHGLGGRVAHAQRRAELPQRRQGAGVQRAAGHAAAAHARATSPRSCRRTRGRCW